MGATLPKLTRFEVSGLLGRFQHKIEFAESETFVILHGPNGVGKTHILKLIRSTLSGQFRAVRAINFETALFAFSTGHEIALRKTSVADEHVEGQEGGSRLELQFRQPADIDSMEPLWTVVEFNERERFDVGIRRYLEVEFGVDQISPTEWLDPQSGSTLDREEVITRYLLNGRFADNWSAGSVDEAVQVFLNRLPVQLVETQRLLTAGEPIDARRGPVRARSSTVDEFARHLAGLISGKLASSSLSSSKLDRSFPVRVLARTSAESLSDTEILHKYAEQSALRSELATVGLLENEPELPLEEISLNDAERRVLTVYLEDADQKLNTFTDLFAKVKLLKEIINERFLYKAMDVTPAVGFIFRADRGGVIAPNQLSSGEQHELVLLYDLLFRTTAGSLVLIDEPEISLHVKWQREFINDLERIASLINLRFVIATHSPQIVDGWYEKAVLLSPEELV